MNCANHTDVSAVAYCRTCGKPLCANCTRSVRGVIYCENCLAARVEGTTPPPPVPPVTPVPPYPPPISGGPNPTVAGMLAGFIPFGVGAVYNSQYAKGLAHLFIMAGLIWGMSSHSRLEPLFILGFFFFWVYQIIDAVRSARAIQLGQPAPDPFGLAQTFGAGEKVDLKRVPTGAIVLIVLGALFLLETTGIFTIDFDRIWPAFLIALGIWLFARGWGLVACSVPRCYCERCRTRRLMGPAVLVTIGVLGLVDSFRGLNFFSWVGALLVVIGVVKIIQGNPSSRGHIVQVTSGGTSGPATPPADSTPQPPVDEVKNV